MTVAQTPLSLIDPAYKVTIIIHKSFEFWTPLHSATRQSDLPIEFGVMLGTQIINKFTTFSIL